MAFRSMNHWKQMANGLRQYASSTSPKMKAYTPAVGLSGQFGQQGSKKFIKGEFVPVYVAVGMITMSVLLGLLTAKHHLLYNPQVFVKKQRRETLPEVVEPEHVVEECEKFIKKSFFRKVAHVQEFDDYNHAVKDVFAHTPDPRQHTTSLKDVGVEPVLPKVV